MVCALSLHLCDVTARAAHGCKLRLNAFDTRISWKTCIATGYVFGQLFQLGMQAAAAVSGF